MYPQNISDFCKVEIYIFISPNCNVLNLKMEQCSVLLKMSKQSQKKRSPLQVIWLWHVNTSVMRTKIFVTIRKWYSYLERINLTAKTCIFFTENICFSTAASSAIILEHNGLFLEDLFVVCLRLAHHESIFVNEIIIHTNMDMYKIFDDPRVKMLEKDIALWNDRCRYTR